MSGTAASAWKDTLGAYSCNAAPASIIEVAAFSTVMEFSAAHCVTVPDIAVKLNCASPIPS